MKFCSVVLRLCYTFFGQPVCSVSIKSFLKHCKTLLMYVKKLSTWNSNLMLTF
jgi:hypothetical protein